MSEELKPCPFCGEAVDRAWTDENCIYHGSLDCILSDRIFNDDWNTRPIEDALRARIAELEEGLREIINLGRDGYYQTKAALTAERVLNNTFGGKGTYADVGITFGNPEGSETLPDNNKRK